MWTAPQGVLLAGPPFWSPDGGSLAVYATTQTTRDLVVVDLVSKQTTWITRQAQVGDVVWSPQATQLAYTTVEPAGSSVWLRSLSSDKSQRLGAGGARLRWSQAGAQLLWYVPTSETRWTEMTWDSTTGAVTSGNVRTAPPADAVWSPDGHSYALLKGPQLLLFNANKKQGQPLDTRPPAPPEAAGVVARR